MLDSKQFETVTRLVQQYTVWAQKLKRWSEMCSSGIATYLIRHDEIFGWETYWTRFSRLQNYAIAKMAECVKQEIAIENKIKMIYKEGA